MASNDHLSKPYVPMDIEELSKVRDLKHWANVKVRVIGTLRGLSTLVSICEPDGPHSITVDLHLLDQYPEEYTDIQVYGEVEMYLSKPQIRVIFFRKLDGLDVEAYQRAVQLQNKYIPHFVKP
jgi:hypothetical protein